MTIQQEKERARREDLITVRQLAILAQKDTQTVYRWVWKNKVPGVVRFGRTILIHRAVALAWSKSSQTQAFQ